MTKKTRAQRRAATPLISMGWAHGRYWDTWMIAHFSSGLTIGCALPFIEAPLDTLYLVALAGLILWEIVEFVFDIHEVIENALLDIFFGFAGVALIATYVTPALSRTGQVWVLALSATITAVLCTFGWRAFLGRHK